MQRCIELAKLGAGSVAPNPMVGAVLVHNGRIIGEGYHEKYGEAHAEPNCIESVNGDDRSLISQATMYVSLEPCTHFGKTPPCADLIIRNKIPKVVIGCRDPFKEGNARVTDVVGQGKGIEKLKAGGVDVEFDVLEKECRELNKRFLCFHEHHRPYIILKWAQTANGKIATLSTDRLHITNEFTNRLVHRWRSEEVAILAGTNTAAMDDPELTTRLWTGNNPVRLVVDMNLKLPATLKIFNDEAPTIIFNKIRHDLEEDFFTQFFLRKVKAGLFYYEVTEDVSLVQQIVNALHQLKIQSVMVEGGARLLQSFIDEEMWDEARVISNEELTINSGLNAPVLSNQRLMGSQKLFSDQITTYRNSILLQ
jgi:diaminohydroxyphosphoribosylaminopyrimidine deaminase/5-amino-6-(5-phosphoribosylamino)uracil reductase